MASPGTSVLTAAEDSKCWSYREDERTFKKLTNEARVLEGLVKLKLDPELSRVARKHTKEMIVAGELYHTPPKIFGARVTRWKKLGENVGRGTGVLALQDAFMQSLVHRDNILKPGYRYMGVGTRWVEDVLWVTVVFEARNNPGTTLKMPKC